MKTERILKTLLLAAALTASAAAFAENPSMAIAFHGFLKDAAGNVPDAKLSHRVDFRLRDGEGNLLWGRWAKVDIAVDGGFYIDLSDDISGRLTEENPLKVKLEDAIASVNGGRLKLSFQLSQNGVETADELVNLPEAFVSLRSREIGSAVSDYVRAKEIRLCGDSPQISGTLEADSVKASDRAELCIYTDDVVTLECNSFSGKCVFQERGGKFGEEGRTAVATNDLLVVGHHSVGDTKVYDMFLFPSGSAVYYRDVVPVGYYSLGDPDAKGGVK